MPRTHRRVLSIGSRAWQVQTTDNPRPAARLSDRLDESGARHMEVAANPPDRKLETCALAMPCLLIVPCPPSGGGRWPWPEAARNPGDCAP